MNTMVKENGMVMMSEKEHDLEIDLICKDYEKRINMLQEAILELSKGAALSSDARVSKKDFLDIYQKALGVMFDNMEKSNFDELPNDIYGHDITVHWHGIYCNCGDGATPSNYIISGIEGCVDEDPTEYEN